MKNEKGKIKSIGEIVEGKNSYLLALTTMEDGKEGYIYKKSKEEIELMRNLVGKEVPYSIQKAQDRVYMTIYQAEVKEEPKKGYADTAAAQKDAWYKNKETYFQDKLEWEKTHYTQRHYDNLLAPFYLEVLKAFIDKVPDDKIEELMDKTITNMITRSDELFKISQK